MNSIVFFGLVAFAIVAMASAHPPAPPPCDELPIELIGEILELLPPLVDVIVSLLKTVCSDLVPLLETLQEVLSGCID